jgi:hypothetical protein
MALPVLQITIHNAPMANVMDGDHLFLNLDLINYSIIPNVEAIEPICYRYLDCLRREWF